jgi:hypothetical protein
MTAIEITEIELVLVFLKSLLKKQSEPESLDAQNLRWSTEVLKGVCLRSRKQGAKKVM